MSLVVLRRLLETFGRDWVVSTTSTFVIGIESGWSPLMSVARCAVLFCACCLRMRLAFCGMTEHLFAVALCMVQVFVFRFGLRYCELF